MHLCARFLAGPCSFALLLLVAHWHFHRRSATTSTTALATTQRWLADDHKILQLVCNLLCAALNKCVLHQDFKGSARELEVSFTKRTSSFWWLELEFLWNLPTLKSRLSTSFWGPYLSCPCGHSTSSLWLQLEFRTEFPMACGQFEVCSTGNIISDISSMMPASVSCFPKFEIHHHCLFLPVCMKGSIPGKTWPCFQEEPPDLDDECIPDLGQWAFNNHRLSTVNTVDTPLPKAYNWIRLAYPFATRASLCSYLTAVGPYWGAFAQAAEPCKDRSGSTGFGLQFIHIPRSWAIDLRVGRDVFRDVCYKHSVAPSSK